MLKKLTLGLIVCFGLVSAYMPVCAAEVEVSAQPETDVIMPRGDVYIYKYMKINGIQHRRLWNVTKGEWAEDSWSPCP